MGKSVKSGYYQKIIQKGLWMERLPRAMYLQKRLWMEGLPRATYLQRSHRWKGFQGQCIYRKVADGKASKGNVFTERGQVAEVGLAVP